MTPAAGAKVNVGTPLLKPEVLPDAPAAGHISRTISVGVVNVGGRDTTYTLEAFLPWGRERKRPVRLCRKCKKPFVRKVNGQEYCRSPCRSPTERNGRNGHRRL